MKKRISLLLCLLLLTGCAATYDGPTESKTVPSQILTTHYDPETGDSRYSRTDYAYDIYGNQSMELEYGIRSHDEEAKPHLKTLRSFDENGNIIRQRQYDVSGLFPKKLVDVRYEYDDQGRLTATTHRPGEAWDNDTTVYDDEARTRTYIGHNGTAIDYMNELGWVIRTEQVFSDGRAVLTEYDRRPDGQIAAMRDFENGVLKNETVITYDDQGRMLTLSNIVDGVSEPGLRWEYGEDYTKCFDSSGCITVTGYNPDGSKDYIQVIDAQDQVITLTLYHYTEIQVPIEEVSP